MKVYQFEYPGHSSNYWLQACQLMMNLYWLTALQLVVVDAALLSRLTDKIS